MAANEEENFLSKAFRIISDELPKFFTETNTPFLGKDEEKSVMRESSSGQREKEIVEGLLTAGAMAPMAGRAVGKVASVAAKNPTLTAALSAIGLQDPTALLSGPIGAADAISSLTGGGGSIKNAEATIVPANLIRNAGLINIALERLQRGLKPVDVYKGPVDNKLRAVISDAAAKFNSKPPPGKASADWVLGDMIDHPELFEAMPDLKNIKIRPLTAEQKASGLKAAYLHPHKDLPEEIRYTTKGIKDGNELLSNMLHEIQHAIQQRGGFQKGANFESVLDAPEFSSMLSQSRNQRLQVDDETVFKDLQKDLYKRTAGEAEARAVQYMKTLGDSGDSGAYTAFPLGLYDTNIAKLIRSTLK